MLRSPSLLGPFVIFAAMQFLVLVCLALFFVSPLSAVMVPVVERIGGEHALHYPTHMVLLPRMYHLVYLPLAVVAGFVLFGWAVSMMVEYYEHMGVKISRRAGRKTSQLIPSLMVLGLIFVLSVTAIQFLFAYLGNLLTGAWPGRVMWLAGVAGSIAVQILLVYSVFFLVTKASNPFEAVAKSAGFGRRSAGLTGLIVFTVFLIHLPVDYLTQRPDAVALKFDPQLVFVLLATGIVLEIFTNFFLFASTTAAVTGGRRAGLE